MLVSGANSLLGTNTIKVLLDEGYRVRGLLRHLSSFHLPPHPALEIIEGNMTDRDTLKKVLEGVTDVIHVAACTRQDLPRYDQYRKVNVEATEQLLGLVIEAEAKRFVYVSSANCFGYGTLECPGNEQTPICGPFKGSYYARSKVEAQGNILQYKDKIDIVIVNPNFMLGAYDSKPSSGRIIMMGYGKRVVFYPPGGKNFVHVGAAALGVVRAMERGRNGEHYLLSGENMDYRRFYDLLAEQTGDKPLYIRVPKPLLLTVGAIGNALRFVGIANDFTMPNMRILCINNYYSNHKAETELEVTIRPTSEAIRDALAWFEEKGMLPGGGKKDSSRIK